MTAISLQARKKRIGKIEERYGLKKQEAQRQGEEWNATLADEKTRPKLKPSATEAWVAPAKSLAG